MKQKTLLPRRDKIIVWKYFQGNNETEIKFEDPKNFLCFEISFKPVLKVSAEIGNCLSTVVCFIVSKGEMLVLIRSDCQIFQLIISVLESFAKLLRCCLRQS